MSSEFVVWQHRSVAHAAVFTELRGFEDIYRFDAGQPLLAEFPADAAFHMNPDFPNDLLLPDNVANSLRTLLVSARLRQALQDAGVTDVEYLPLSIVDHQGRVASAEHVVVHPLGLVDCIDLEQSVYRPHRIVKGKIDKVTRLVLDARRVPAERQLFKLKGFNTIVIARRALAERLSQGGFSGLDWLDLERFPS